MSSWLYLVYFSFRRQLRFRRLAVAFVLFVIISLVVGFSGSDRLWSATRFSRWIMEPAFCRFFLPIIALTFGTAVIGDEREDKTLVYLSIRPISRGSLFLAKLLGSVPLVLGISLGALFGLCATASACGELPIPLLEMVWVFVPTVTLGALAYLAFFGWLGVVFRNAILIGVAHVFLVEIFMGNVPGVLKQISISFYVRSMLYDAVPKPAVEVRVRGILEFQPFEGDEASVALIVVAAGFLLLGTYWFSRREYRDLT